MQQATKLVDERRKIVGDRGGCVVHTIDKFTVTN